MMCRQAAALVVVMVSFVTSRLKRKKGLDLIVNLTLYYMHLGMKLTSTSSKPLT